MKGLRILVPVVVALMLTYSLTAAAATTAIAEEHPVGGSGIHALVHFTDDGSALTVDGTATGLTPGKPYFSLIYTAGVGPGGVPEGQSLPPTSNAIPACNDLSRAGTSLITPTQMPVGFWKNNNDGTGTLHVVKTMHGNSQEPLWIALGLQKAFEAFGVIFGGNSYAPIGNTWRTVSVRDVANNFALVACGLVH